MGGKSALNKPRAPGERLPGFRFRGMAGENPGLRRSGFFPTKLAVIRIKTARYSRTSCPAPVHLPAYQDSGFPASTGLRYPRPGHRT